MMKWLNSMFSESSDVSLMRVMSFIVCLTACYLAVSKGPDESGIIGTLLVTAFTGKVAQKYAETKNVS